MFINYFTEQPFSSYPEAEARIVHPGDHPAYRPGDTAVLFSNRYFDPIDAVRLYSERIEQAVLAEEVGFDGIMANEHHNAPFSMSNRCNIASTVLATKTSRVKIVQLGNLVPLWDNPINLAEEIAMIDLISGGRVVAGMVRGSGTELFCANSNPAYNRERFEEAHDLILKIWTTPGPFRWEGEHYHFRVVNPWSLPLQKPHPRIFIPGALSPETISFAAQHGYPFVVLNTTIETAHQIWALYGRLANEAGFEAGPEHRGYLMRIHVADTEERAVENARQFQWMFGEFSGIAHPVWVSPVGYRSRESRFAQTKRERSSEVKIMSSSIEAQLAMGTIIAGTPDSVRPKIRRWLEETRPGSLMLWMNDGKVNHRDSMRCIELMGKEVLPAIREMGAELGLKGPFELNSPVSINAGPQVSASVA